MKEHYSKTDQETELEDAIRSFEQEKENVRKIIGKIGGVPSDRARLINVIFITLVLVIFALSILYGGKIRFFMIELGILLLSLKLVYFLESYMRLNHFQFWILSSLEWRIDRIDKVLKDIRSKLEK
ncbi:MAG: hypothetical protein PHH49_00980 [Candidatus Omnitrophica bacterium]|nr:hypothetical protein [Candidatus Omnitrophota bacterium]MDD5487526.1 hypothetical protein [Candidatus Omnitrophota bacterium]